MKTRHVQSILFALGVAFAASLPQPGRASDLLTAVVQASGANWNGVIWQTNNGSGVPIGAAKAPVAGNTCQVICNGTSIGNTLNNARIRSVATAGIQTFPGDSLTLNIKTPSD